MRHYFGIGQYLLCCIVTRHIELCELLPPIGQCLPITIVKRTVGVDHATARLITYLYPTRRYASLLYGSEHLTCVFGHLLKELVKAESFPSLWFLLATGVSPKVGIMEVYHHGQLSRCSGLGFGYNIGRIVKLTGCILRINPYAQAYSLYAQLFHQFGTTHLLTLSIIEVATVGLHFSVPTDVGSYNAFYQVRRFRRF